MRILSLTLWSKGRDVDIVEPVLSYLEIFKGAKVQRKSLRNNNWAWDIFFSDYEVLILPNASGAIEYFEAARLASQLGKRVYCFVSEGDFIGRQAAINQSFWGWNHEHLPVADIYFLWSHRTKKYIEDHLEDCPPNIQVCGGTGFDKYRIIKYSKTKCFGESIRINLDQQVVGIAGWCFSSIYEREYELSTMSKVLTRDEFHALRDSFPLVQQMIRDLLLAFPKVLFVLKPHPANPYHSSEAAKSQFSEFRLAAELENHWIAPTNAEIGQLIFASDLWISFISTTSMEAWLLKKPTIAIRPLSSLEPELSSLVRGSPRASNSKELIEWTKVILSKNELREFDELKLEREKIITEVLNYSDGLNHKRAVESICKNLEISKSSYVKFDQFIFKKLVITLTIGFIHRLIYPSALRFIVYWQYKKFLRGVEYRSSFYSEEERSEETRKYNEGVRFFHSRGMDCVTRAEV